MLPHHWHRSITHLHLHTSWPRTITNVCSHTTDFVVLLIYTRPDGKLCILSTLWNKLTPISEGVYSTEQYVGHIFNSHSVPLGRDVRILNKQQFNMYCVGVIAAFRTKSPYTQLLLFLLIAFQKWTISLCRWHIFFLFKKTFETCYVLNTYNLLHAFWQFQWQIPETC